MKIVSRLLLSFAWSLSTVAAFTTAPLCVISKRKVAAIHQRKQVHESQTKAEWRLFSSDDNGEESVKDNAGPTTGTVTKGDDGESTRGGSLDALSDPLRRQTIAPPSSRSLSANERMMAMGTNPRRIFLGVSSATGIALLGNFLGITSQLLTLVPESVLEPTGIDTYFPRGDYKRVNGKGYTFVIPREWVGDTFIELAKSQRATRPLDYKMNQGRSTVTLPDAAFGPPGRLNPRTGVSEQGDTNVSVIVAGGLTGFSLQGTLGSPTEVADKLIRLSLAPEGSGRTIALTSAIADAPRQVYQLEYTVDRGNNKPLLRAISVIAAGSPEGTKLITLTVTAPNQVWDTDPALAAKLERIASSFHTTS